MKIGAWYANSSCVDSSFEGKTKFSPQGAEITLKDAYSTAYISCMVTDFNKDEYIDLNIDISCDACKYDVFAEWLKDGTEIFKEYIEENSSITPYNESDSLIISVLVRGEKGIAKISIPVAKQERKIIKRKAKVAALSIPYGFISEHKTRTCEDNLNDSIQRINRLCKNDNLDLVVLTETFYSRNTAVDYVESCLTVDSPQIERLISVAKDNNIYLAFSFREKDEKGYFYNSALLIDRMGNIIANYHKSHLTMNEKIKGLKAGNEIIIVDTDFGKVSFAICWDLYYPEYVKELSKRGAELIINPSAGYHKDMHCLRAKSNGVYIVTAGVWGDTTTVINPEGKIISNGIMTGAAVADISFGERYPVRYLSCGSSAEYKNVYLNELRNDLYNK